MSGSHATADLTVDLADADLESTSANTIGVAAEDILSNTTGLVQVFGYLRGLTTNGYAGAEGSALYLSDTAGQMQSGLPTQPKHGVRVGFLVKKAGAGAGSIFINIQNYQEMEELSDVLIGTLAPNDFLTWNNTLGVWQNISLNGDKGDITVTSNGQTWTIDNTAVTYAKIQNVSATDRILGRQSAGAGTIEEITCTAAGRALIDDADATAQRATLGLGALATQGDGDKGDITVSSSGSTWTIDNGVVTFAKMQPVGTNILLGNDASGVTIQDIPCTPAGRALLDDADAAAQRTTLGLGALATQGDGDKGDITVSASGATWTIDSGVVSPTNLTTGGPSWTTGGDLTATGDIIVGGNDLKSSGGTTVISMSGADASMQGNTSTKGVTEGVVAIGTVTTSHTLDLTNGTIQTATLTASTACTFTMPTATAGKSFTFLLKQDAVTGNGTATFTGVKWPSTGAPTITATAGSMDILAFVADGTNWYGTVVQGYTP